MPRATPLTTAALRLARPFMRLAIRPHDFAPPRKALILKPCCLSQLMLATPLLRQLAQAYPTAQFDWAAHDWARPAIATNPRVRRILATGQVGLPTATWAEVFAFARTLRQQGYDTCFIPSSSAVLSLVAWLAGIPQRVGLDEHGRGVWHTTAVAPPPESHTAERYLALAHAIGLPPAPPRPEFFPSDANRTRMTERLVDEMGWLGDVPLVLLHPGGGSNPAYPDERKRWPTERFARLANHLARQYQAKILVLGDEQDKPLADALVGMVSAPLLNLAGRTTLGELGALAEVATLYVGNDAGATHVAAAVGCPVLAIYGVDAPDQIRPYAPPAKLTTLWRPYEGAFSWAQGVTAEEAMQAVDRLVIGNW